MKGLFLFLFMLVFTASKAQDVVTVDSVSFKDGYKTLFAMDRNWAIGMMVKDTPTFESKFSILVYLVNNGNRGVNISPSNFTITYVNHTGKDIETGVYEADEWRKRERRNILWFGPENTSQVRVEKKSEVKDNSGNIVKGNETTTSTVYTGAKDAAYEQLDKSLEGYLRKSTVAPKKSATGYIILKNKKTKKIIVKVKIGEVNYIFDLTKN